MPNAFTSKELKAITALIRNWPLKEKLTWDAICEQSQVALGFIPTRQALSSKTIVANAYKIRKQEVSSHRDRLAGVPLPKSLSSAAEQILKLQEENKKLKQEIQQLAEMAQILIHNATTPNEKGYKMTKEQLMKPIPNRNRKIV